MLVSIIICTRNRANFLHDCLSAIAAAIRMVPNGTDDCEIVLVNNGSVDHTVSALESWSNSSPDIILRIVGEEKAGLSNARNAGFASAKGYLLIWTDDDCHMDNQYIVTALKFDANDSTPIIRGGRIELGDENDLPLTIKTSTTVERWSKADKSARSKPLSGVISGANIVVRRSVVNLIGLCDVRLGAGVKIAGSEDTDYLCRAYTKGMIIEYVPDLVVYHFHRRRTAEQGQKLLTNYNIGAGAIYIKHIFNDFDLFRPFIWNIKNALNEIKQSRNLYLPEYNLSYKKIIALNIYGMFLYIRYLILNKF